MVRLDGAGARFGRERMLRPALCGLVLVVGLVWLDLLFINAPLGWEPISWLARRPIALFAVIFRYPLFSFGAREFSRIALASICALWAAYFCGAAGLWRPFSTDRDRRAAVVLVVGVAALAQVFLVLLPPVFSNDLYHYAIFGRMVTVHHLNPYVTSATAVPNDILAPFAYWKSFPTHYGPVFTWLSAGAAAAGGNSVVGTAIAFKAMTAGFNLANCALVYRLGQAGGGNGLRPLVLYAWNPLILVESAGSGHNDAIMMTFALLGLWLFTQDRPAAGFASLVLSCAVKYVTGIVLLLQVARTLGQQPTRRAAVALAGRFALVGAALAVALYAPFWEGARGFAGVIDLALFDAGIAYKVAVFGLFAVGSAVVAAKGPAGRVLELSAITMIGFVFVVFRWFFPWYVIPALTLVLAGTGEQPRSPAASALAAAALCLAAFAMLLYGLIGQVTRPG